MLQKNPPAEELICPISQELRLDSVVAGRVYEREEIEEHFKTQCDHDEVSVWYDHGQEIGARSSAQEHHRTNDRER